MNSPKQSRNTIDRKTSVTQSTKVMEDNRPQALMQRKLQENINNKSQQVSEVVSSPAQSSKRTGIKRIWHAMRHPIRAYKNKKANRVDTEDSSWFDEIVSKNKASVPNMNHTIQTVNHNEVSEYVDQLKEWLEYVDTVLEDNKTDWEQSKRERAQISDHDYYNGEQDSFRAAHKNKQRLLSDCQGAKDEIESILKDIESGREKQYLIAMKDGQFQGILQTNGSERTVISNIAVNPANIYPRDGERAVKNTLRDLLQPVISTNLKNDTEVELYALSSRVKKIYDHYGFLVDGHRKRPNVSRNENGWRTTSGKDRTDQIKGTNSWFKSDKMSMNRANQEEFIRKYYSE